MLTGEAGGIGSQGRMAGGKLRTVAREARIVGGEARIAIFEEKTAAILAVEFSILARMESVLGVDVFLPATDPAS
jgi:hypothetical protein